MGGRHGRQAAPGGQADPGKEYQRACPMVLLRYNPIGSGGGIAQFRRGATSFGGTDTPVEGRDAVGLGAQCAGGRIINLPLVGGPIAMGYNLPDVDELVLDAETLARIFDSRITRWNDPAIQKLNPGAELPPLAINPVHRSDGSGTTQNFQAYLADAAPDVWQHPAEKAWHGRGGSAEDGSEAVASAVNYTVGSIGYFELSYARELGMSTVRIDTGAAQPVAASTTTASAGIATADVIGRGKDMILRLDYQTSAPETYPIVLISYEIVCEKGNLPATLPALKSFLTYTASEEGQEPLSRIHYAPLPESVATEVRKVINTLR
ncbi:phosphate ABC transporter substrate-binding protein PstS [Streptomyces sp. NPDC127197]|uniref:phosphate ABC transporter substrate-binding protein PstS n=1 Tax=Streptomyces sp. NPDC127197 TaxID=3345388 RepID=UPI003640BBB2